MQPLPCGPSLPADVWDHIATSYFTTKQWARGPALACKAMHQARQEQLIVHAGVDEGLKCLAAVAHTARRFGDCRLLDLKLLLKSDMPKFKQKLLSALKAGCDQLGSIAAFRFSLEVAPGTTKGLVECQEWLLPRMTGLHALSLSARLYTGLGHMTSLRYLALSVPWHPSLVQFLGGLSPSLESLMLQTDVGTHTKGEVIDVRHLTRLSRLAVRDVGSCNLLLPEACQVYAYSPCHHPKSMGESAAMHITGGALDCLVLNPHGGVQYGNTDARIVQTLQTVPRMRDLSLLGRFHGLQPVLRLNATTLAPVKHLTSLRVLSPSHGYGAGGKVKVRVPASLELRSLVLAAHNIKAGL